MERQSSQMAQGSIGAAFTDKREPTAVPSSGGHDSHIRAAGDDTGKSHLANAMKHLASDHAGGENKTPDEMPLKHQVDKPGV